MSTDRRTPPITPADVVLGQVREQDRDEVARLLREDPVFRAEVDRLQQIASALTGLPQTAEPVPTLDLDAALRARAPHRNRLRPGVSWPFGRVPLVALAVSVAVLLFGGGMLAGTALDGGSSGGDRPIAVAPDGPAVTLAALDGAGAQRARAVMPSASQPDGEMELRVSDAAPSKPGEYYELWLLDDKRTTPIGTFRVGADGTARVRFPLAIDPSSYRFLDVSIESDDGDPAHSGVSVLRSPALS